jgi:hypothetical protein
MKKSIFALMVFALMTGVVACMGAADASEEVQQWKPAADVSANVQWKTATHPSCDNTCQAASLAPVISGYYVNGYAFYVCAANAKGEGYRAGYNLRPAWTNACIVGWGGEEISVKSYRCLCQ